MTKIKIKVNDNNNNNNLFHSYFSRLFNNIEIGFLCHYMIGQSYHVIILFAAIFESRKNSTYFLSENFHQSTDIAKLKRIIMILL